MAERCEAELGAEIARDYDGSRLIDAAAEALLAASDGGNSDAEADSSKVVSRNDRRRSCSD